VGWGPVESESESSMWCLCLVSYLSEIL
jgi:hypothetical protein